MATDSRPPTADRGRPPGGGELVYFVTGSQGEEFSVLSRMSKKKYNDLQIDNNDIVLMSSSVIPGNENKVLEQLKEEKNKENKNLLS